MAEDENAKRLREAIAAQAEADRVRLAEAQADARRRREEAAAQRKAEMDRRAEAARQAAIEHAAEIQKRNQKG